MIQSSWKTTFLLLPIIIRRHLCKINLVQVKRPCVSPNLGVLESKLYLYQCPRNLHGGYKVQRTFPWWTTGSSGSILDLLTIQAIILTLFFSMWASIKQNISMSTHPRLPPAVVAHQMNMCMGMVKSSQTRMSRMGYLVFYKQCFYWKNLHLSYKVCASMSNKELCLLLVNESTAYFQRLN